VKTIIVTVVLIFTLLGPAPTQPSAFSQQTNQAEIKRKPKARVEPRYPALARQLNLSGKVRIEVTVSPDGTVTSPRVIGGNPILVNAVLDVVRMWKYETGPKETVEVVEVDFNAPQK
jgi:TonB family protein